MSELNLNRRLVAGHQWGVQLRREIDVLVAAMQGVGVTATIQALATEAVLADNGTLKDTAGHPGFAWDPAAQTRKGSRDVVTQRIRAAGASIGRIMAGGHPNHRTYLAVLEAVYVVTVAQDYDVAERIEKLWDQSAALVEVAEEEQAVPRKRGLLHRLWDAIKRHWFGVECPRDDDEEVVA